MTEPLNFDVDYKALIREKLLDAYEKNPYVLEKIIQLKNKADLSTNNKYKFFSHTYLAGILVALCPEITNFITVSLDFNSDLDSVLYILGLNFDPRPELAKRAEARKLAQEATLIEENKISSLLAEDPEYRAVHEGLEEIRAQIRQQENSS